VNNLAAKKIPYARERLLKQAQGEGAGKEKGEGRRPMLLNRNDVGRRREGHERTKGEQPTATHLACEKRRRKAASSGTKKRREIQDSNAKRPVETTRGEDKSTRLKHNHQKKTKKKSTRKRKNPKGNLPEKGGSKQRARSTWGVNQTARKGQEIPAR